MARRASSMWHLVWVRILVFQPFSFLSWQIALQSSKDSVDAQGLVNSMYSTPNSANEVAILILVSLSKKALANCSPSAKSPPQISLHAHTQDRSSKHSPRRVLSIILKLFTFLRREKPSHQLVRVSQPVKLGFAKSASHSPIRRRELYWLVRMQPSGTRYLR